MFVAVVRSSTSYSTSLRLVILKPWFKKNIHYLTSFPLWCPLLPRCRKKGQFRGLGNQDIDRADDKIRTSLGEAWRLTNRGFDPLAFLYVGSYHQVRVKYLLKLPIGKGDLDTRSDCLILGVVEVVVGIFVYIIEKIWENNLISMTLNIRDFEPKLSETICIHLHSTNTTETLPFTRITNG